MDYFAQVPQEYKENMKWRISHMQQCERDSVYRKASLGACREDVLYFFSSFCLLFEPRRRYGADGMRLPPIVPFTPWPHQIKPIRTIRETLGEADIAIEKSRGEGASWIMVLMALHDLLFTDYAQIGLVSSKKDNVDIPNNLNTLFGKIIWELEQLPLWMVGVRGKDWIRSINKTTIENARNNSMITGYAATSDVASGSRALWFGLDELSKFPRPDDDEAMVAVQQVTESRFVVATPLGTGGAYYELMHEATNMEKLVLSWEDNPTRNRGLYRFKGTTPIAEDPENNPLLPNYNPPSEETRKMFTRLRRRGYRLHQGLRSPWFDRECDRPRATPQSIAQELSRDYGGSTASVFSDLSMQAMTDSMRPELILGNLDYHPVTLKHTFSRADDGECSLWCPLDAGGIPPSGMYAAGADIAVGDAGTHTSNSVLIVANMHTREQVFEWVSNSTSPTDFADFSIAVCNWFHGALLAWEQNGPGVPYSRQVLEKRAYEKVLRRTTLTGRSRRRTKEYGWWSDQKTKEILFADFIQGLSDGEIVIRSKETRREATQYIRKNGLIQHNSVKPTALRQGQEHGDRIIAAAIVYQAMKDMPIVKKPSERIIQPKDVPINSLAYRERYFENQRNKAKMNQGLDTRTIKDLMR